MSQQNPYGGPPEGPQGAGGQQPGQAGQGQPGPGQPGPAQPGPGQPWPGQPGWNPGPSPYPGANPAGPPPGGGYAFGPFSPGPNQNPYAAGPGQPQGQYGPGQPPPGGPTAPVKRRNRLPLVLGAAALALVLLIVGIVAAVRSGDDRSTTATDPATGSTPTAAAALVASDAVKGYLEAVAAGDATAAVSFASQPVDDDSLIDADVLADSRKRAPLTDISVPVVDDKYAYEVPATYKLGGKSVSEKFYVEKVSEAWKLSSVAATIDLSNLNDDGVPILVNGKRVTSDQVSALPGSYVITTTLKNLAIGPRNTVTVSSPKTLVDTYTMKSTLSSAGKSAVIAATKSNFTTCLKAKALRPKNCPFFVTSNGHQLRASTIKFRRYGSDPFKNPRIDVDGTTAELALKVKVKATVTCERGNRCTADINATNYARYDLTAKSLEPDWQY